MTFTDAAREVLRMTGRPLHYKEITEIAIERNLLSHVGKSPEVTMGARLAATLKKMGDDNPLVRVKPGVFALREWDDDTIRQGLDVRSPEGADEIDDDAELGDAPPPSEERPSTKPTERIATGGEDGRFAEPVAREARPAPSSPRAPAPPLPRAHDGFDEDELPPSPDEELRAEIAAGATELFAEEDDDDQPILRPLAEEQPDEAGGEGRRRRRRRRRRGPRPNEDGAGGGLPTYTATPAFEEGDPARAPQERGPQVIDVAGEPAGGGGDLAGRDLAEAIAVILQGFDRAVGAVSLRQIAELAQRRGRLSGDVQLAQSHVAAAVRADQARRLHAGLRPRFRLAAGRVGLTDWVLDGELARLERDALGSLARYREAARRAFSRKCAELPGHAFVELCLLLLERLGVGKVRPVKFPGASGAEAHFAGVLHLPCGQLPGPIATGDGMKIAVIVRRDGRDLGRERVTELRGTSHHYDGADMGWIFTSGQVLSGAREEAAAHGVMPVALIDAQAIARLCEEHAVAVVEARFCVPVPDVDLFEALRAS
jgi:hypothetical protein